MSTYSHIPRRLIHDTSFLRLQAVCDTVLKSFKEANYMVRSARVYSPGEWQLFGPCFSLKRSMMSEAQFFLAPKLRELLYGPGKTLHFFVEPNPCTAENSGTTTSLFIDDFVESVFPTMS